MIEMTRDPLLLREVRFADANFYICGISAETKLDFTDERRMRGLQMFLLPDTMWLLARRDGWPDSLISPAYVKHLTLQEDFDACAKVKADEAARKDKPLSPGLVAAQKKVAAKKAALEEAKKNK